MMFLRVAKHIGIIMAGVVLTLGIPLWASGYLHSLFSVDPDALSSASVILDQPSGDYLVLVNRLMHPDEEKLADWITFFSGGEILYIFEDVSCSVATSDPGGRELAESYRSRLPENQMQVKAEDGTLVLSRAEQGLYDILVMSREFADAFGASSVFGEDTVVIEVSQETSSETASESESGGR